MCLCYGTDLKVLDTKILLLAAIDNDQDKDDGSEEKFEDAKEESASRSGSVASSRSEVFQDASDEISVSVLQLGNPLSHDLFTCNAKVILRSIKESALILSSMRHSILCDG